MAKKKARREGAESGRGSAFDWYSSDKSPQLLPTPWLTPYEFEEFLHRLLRAQRFLDPAARRVVSVERYGRTGDKQDGIDHVGKFSDGVAAAWQCKHLDKLRPFEVRDAVEEATYVGAKELYLVFARVAGSPARAEMAKHAGWTLWDREQLTEMLRELPLQRQRDILDATWGPDVRRAFLQAPGDSLVSVESFASSRRNERSAMNDLGPLVGRETEVTALEQALDRTAPARRQVVVVNGPAGRGKSRLVTDVLVRLQERQPAVPVVCLDAGHPLEVRALAEMPLGPAVVFVDDAHHDPVALAPLLGMARSNPDLQVVLATRPSAEPDVLAQVRERGFTRAEIETISVEALTPAQARALVDGLLDGYANISFALRSYLASQAEQSPFIAVITTHLIKTGQISGYLAIDESLREQVLDRYRETIGGPVDGTSSRVVQRVLATYAGLDSISVADEQLRARVAEFNDLPVADLAALQAQLVDRGVLVVQGDLVRVFPELLAEHMLESVAVRGGVDTGFVSDLWEEFGVDRVHKLTRSLAELDWRLAQQGGPKVLTPVWKSLRERLSSPFPNRVADEVGRMSQMAQQHPGDVVALLEELRARLDREDAASEPVEVDEEEALYRRMFGTQPITRDAARLKLAPLYARAAANDPEQLEVCLDALWALRRRDGRAPHSNTEHAERMLTDSLANLGELPHLDFAQRIVARVRVWLKEPAAVGDVVTPLFALAPLLEKETLSTFQSSLHELSFDPHIISAAATRDLRDSIRAILCDVGMGDDLRRAGAAIDLLHSALRQPHGYFGQSIGEDAIMQWEDDDLASIAVLDELAASTEHAAVRRRIRHHVSWSAEHALSLPVRRTALDLLIRLDAIADLEDQVADVILNEHLGLNADPERVLPTLEEMRAEREAEHDRLKLLSPEEKEADRNARIHAKVESDQQFLAQSQTILTKRLAGLRDPAAVIDQLEVAARAVLLVAPAKTVTLWSLWRELAALVPDQVESLLRESADRSPGPLDGNLYVLFNEWLQIDREAALLWVEESMVDDRAGIRLSIAQGFSAFGWHSLGPRMAAIWLSGADDHDRVVSQAFLAAAGSFMRADPRAAVEALLARDVDARGATRAIEDASQYKGRSWGAALSEIDAAAVLRLVPRASPASFSIDEVVYGITGAHPGLVLDHLLNEVHDGERFGRHDLTELGEAFAQHASVLAHWVRDHLDDSATRAVLETAVGLRLRNEVAGALAELIDELSDEDFERLVTVMASLSTWAIDSPQLAHRVVVAARERQLLEQLLPLVESGMAPRMITAINGVSAELDAARVRAREAVESATDPDLKRLFERAEEALRTRAEEMRDLDDGE